jgi:hypothetical protein
MDADAVTSKDRRAFAVVVAVATALVLAAWLPAPIGGVSTVLLQGLPTWLR